MKVELGSGRVEARQVVSSVLHELAEIDTAVNLHTSGSSIAEYFSGVLLGPEGPTGTTIHPPSPFVVTVRQPQVMAALLAELVDLRAQVRQLREALDSRPNVFSLTIQDVGVDTLKVVVPFSVVVEETGDETVARWPARR